MKLKTLEQWPWTYWHKVDDNNNAEQGIVYLVYCDASRR